MKLKIAFVCTGNSCRSQMAEGLARYYYGDVFEIYSAGTKPAKEINQKAIEVMKEIGIDIIRQYPKMLEQIPEQVDILIKMGCDITCPFIPSGKEEDWGLEDPAGKDVEAFRKIRENIREKLDNLVEGIKKP